ncbi:hypothetical protein ACLOJK_030640 [Asimina triloba]
MEGAWLLNAEGILRVFTMLAAISSACVIGNAGETKEIFPSIRRKATNTDVPALTILVIVEAVVAAYNFIQLCKCAIFLRLQQNPSETHAKAAWVCYILDQVGPTSNSSNLLVAPHQNGEQVQKLTNCGKKGFYILNLGYVSEQMMAYVSFAALSAATEASMLSVMGMSEFQWMKLCSIFSSFCLQVGAGLLCAFGATALAAAVAAISAFYLFRRYSPKCFLALKG